MGAARAFQILYARAQVLVLKFYASPRYGSHHDEIRRNRKIGEALRVTAEVGRHPDVLLSPTTLAD
jgi:hypothetical protein